jgi:hypothetical protein
MPVVVFIGMLHAIMGMGVTMLSWFQYGGLFPRFTASATITHGIFDLIIPVKIIKSVLKGLPIPSACMINALVDK